VLRGSRPGRRPWADCPLGASRRGLLLGRDSLGETHWGDIRIKAAKITGDKDMYGGARLRWAVTVVATALSALALLAHAAGAGAARHRQAHHHAPRKHHAAKRCKRGLVLRTTTRKRHGRKVRVERCVKRKTAESDTPGAVFPVPVPVPAVLAVHIVPSLGRLPYDPLGATVGVSAAASVSPLPEGGISLFVDGVGQCVVPVGGSTTSGECLVRFPAIGPNRLQALYAAGPASNVIAATARETVPFELEPLGVTSSAVVEDEAFAPPHEECEQALIDAHECSRLLLGRITIAANRSPAGAEGSELVSVGAPVCRWFELRASCGAQWSGGPLWSEGWGRLVLYEWAEGEARGLVVNGTLPRQTKSERLEDARDAWQTLEANDLDPHAQYLARARFVTNLTGYASSEPTTPLTLLP